MVLKLYNMKKSYIMIAAFFQILVLEAGDVSSKIITKCPSFVA